eukprot:11323817-Alexandrium_andersonii.AAC.1
MSSSPRSFFMAVAMTLFMATNAPLDESIVLRWQAERDIRRTTGPEPKGSTGRMQQTRKRAPTD